MRENIQEQEKTISQKVTETSKHFMIYLMGAAFQAIVSFVLIPIYTRFLNVEQYGTFALINLVGILASGLFYLGITSSLARYFYEFDSNDNRDLVLNTSLLLTLIGACMQISLGFIFFKYLSLKLFGNFDYSEAILFNIISTAFTFVNNILYLILRYLKKSVSYVFINFIGLLLNLGLSVFLLNFLSNKLIAATLALLISQFILTIILLVYCYSYFSSRITMSHLKQQLKFGMPAAYSGFLIYFIEWFDRLVLNKFLPLQEVGIYSFGYRLGTMVQAFYIVPFCFIWAPMRMEYHKDQNTTKLFQVMLTYYFLVGMILTSFISIFSDIFIRIFTRSPEYLSAYKVIPVIMFSVLLFGSVNILDFGIFIKKKPIYFTFILMFVLFINASMNYLFVPLGGIYAAAFIKMFSYVLLVFSVYYVSNRLYTFPVEVWRIALIICISFLTFGTASFIKIESVYLNFLAKFVLFLIQIILILFFVITSIERNHLKLVVVKYYNLINARLLIK